MAQSIRGVNLGGWLLVEEWYALERTAVIQVRSDLTHMLGSHLQYSTRLAQKMNGACVLS